MTAIYAKKAAIVQKVEGAYGVDSTPAAATDALLVHNLRSSPLKNAYVDRNPVMPFFGNQGKVVAASWAELSYDVEMAGGGVAATPAKYAAALKSCGLAETIGADVQYDPITSGVQSSTIKYYEDGTLHTFLGALGNAVFSLKSGGDPMISFRWMALHLEMTDVALITPTLTAVQIPVAVNKVNTTPFTLHGFAGIFREISIDLGNVLSYRNAPNFEGIRFVDRKTRGRVVMEKDLVAAKNWQSIIKAATTGALTATHGLIAGNIVKLDAGQAQLTNYDESEDEGIKLVSMDIEAKPTAAGNTEFKFTTK